MNKKVKHSLTIVIASLLVLLFILGGLFLLSLPASADPGVLYAAPTASGSGDCSSWADACTLQTALTGASSGDEIWVMAGVHYPGSNRTETFTLQSGVAVYGGFAGMETARDQRAWLVNVTVLSGDIDQNDLTDPTGVVTDTANINGDNAYHVVVTSGVTETAVLDGFIVTAGQADGDDHTDQVRGGGMFNNSGSPTLNNVTFSGNTTSNTSDSLGGGMFNQNQSNPTLTNVTFVGNFAHNGGGMLNINSNSTLTNVTFIENQAEFGGGMFNDDHGNSSHTLTNVTFSGNSATGNGGGIYNYYDSNPTLTNVILWGNTCPSGAGIYNLYSIPQISYSNIQDCGGSGTWNSTCGTDGGGNIEADPLFVDAANGNLHLQLTSPAIDAGDNAALTPDILTDLDSNPRFVDIPTVPDTGSGAPPIVDMGAYETQFVDVTLSKAVLPPSAAPGELITFTLTLTNAGSIPATGIVVTDTIPAWLCDASFTTTLSMTDTGHIPPFVWLVQDLAPEQAGMINVSGVLTVPLAAGTYTNTAFISAVEDLLAENNKTIITFSVPNVGPGFTSTPVLTAMEDALYTYTTISQDDNGDGLTMTAPTLPGWLTFSDHGDGTATLAGTPTTADVGEHAVVLRVADGGELTDTQTFTITVWSRIYLPLVLRNTP